MAQTKEVCGAGEFVTKDQLDLIPIPAETATYKPVAHGDLTRRVLTVSQDLLTGFTLTGTSFKIAREGRQLFAIVTFTSKDNNELALCIGFRNSYDKSFALSMVAGGVVNVCTNLNFRGDIEITRKHTGEVWNEVEAKLIAVCYKTSKTFPKLIENASALKQIAFDDRRAFETMGVLYGHEIISPRQLTVVKDQWLKPSHDAFQPRNAWSFMNACTEALKTSPPSSVLENHVALSQYFDANVLDAEYVIDATFTPTPTPQTVEQTADLNI